MDGADEGIIEVDGAALIDGFREELGFDERDGLSEG